MTRMRGDFRPIELIVAAAVALPMPFVAALGLAMSPPVKTPDISEIDRGASTPMRVKPVLDLDSPLVKLGGGKVKPKMPKAWADPAPAPQAHLAHPSPHAKDDTRDAPSKATAVASAPEAPKSAAPASSASSGPAGSDSAAPVGSGSPQGDPTGKPDGDDKNVVKKRAAKLYYARIAGWFQQRAHATCGVTPEERQKLHAVATVQLGPDGTVLSYSLAPSGNAILDGAAQAAMQSVQGQQIPPPPEDFPELRLNSTSITFVCQS